MLWLLSIKVIYVRRAQHSHDIWQHNIFESGWLIYFFEIEFTVNLFQIHNMTFGKFDTWSVASFMIFPATHIQISLTYIHISFE